MNSTALEKMGLEDYEGFNPLKKLKDSVKAKITKAPNGDTLATTKGGKVINIERAIENLIDANPQIRESMRKYLIVFGKNPNGNNKILSERVYENRKEIHDRFKKKKRPEHINKASWDSYMLSPISAYDFENYEREEESMKGFEGFECFDENFEPLEAFGLQDIGLLAKGAKGLISKIGGKGAKEKDKAVTENAKEKIETQGQAYRHAISNAKKAGATKEELGQIDANFGKHTKRMALYMDTINSNTTAANKEQAARLAMNLQQQKIDTINAIQDSMKDEKIESTEKSSNKTIMIICVVAFILVVAAFLIGKKA